MNKETEPYRETCSQAKRRRMLQFDNEVLDVDIMPLCDEDFSSIYLKSKVSWTCSLQVIRGCGFKPFIYKWVVLGYVFSLMGQMS